MTVKAYAFVDLLGDRFLGIAVGGIEALVIAECAASKGHAAITVWAAETGINRHLLYAVPEGALEVLRIRVEASMVVPGEHESESESVPRSGATT